jgi:hypothetical protein
MLVILYESILHQNNKIDLKDGGSALSLNIRYKLPN